MAFTITRVDPAENHLATIRALIAAAEAADGAPPVSDQAVLAVSQSQRALLLGARAEAPDAPLAAALIGQGELDLVVHPSERGRGAGSAMLAAALAHPTAVGDLRAWAHGRNPAAEALLQRAGFAPMRTLLRMELDPARLPDPLDPLPQPRAEGFRLRPFDPSRPSDPGAWVRANAAAFADHPEQGRITEQDFALITREPWFDPADLILLEATTDHPEPLERGELAGSTWIKTVRSTHGSDEHSVETEPGTHEHSVETEPGTHEHSVETEPGTHEYSVETEPGADESSVETELYALGVRPEVAGRGFGRLLLDVTLARMAQHRPDRVSLYVDGENRRAVELYERAGFTVGSSSRQWERPAPSADDARIGL